MNIVYYLINPDDSKPLYIGVTENIEKLKKDLGNTGKSLTISKDAKEYIASLRRQDKNVGLLIFSEHDSREAAFSEKRRLVREAKRKKWRLIQRNLYH